MVTKRYGLVLAGLLIIALVLIAPVGALDHILNPGDSIQQNITDAVPGDTLILNPGTYSENTILVSKEIIIRANPSRSGTAANTIIDAGSVGRIFYNPGGYLLTLTSLSLKNGKAPNGSAGPIVGEGLPGMAGGAVFSTGPVTVISSIFTNCSAGNGGMGGPSDGLVPGGDGGPGGYGGAIFANGTVTVLSSTFTNCSAGTGGNGGPGDTGLQGGRGGPGGYGGAVYTAGTVNIASSTFTGTTGGNGGTGANGGSSTSGWGGDGGDGGIGGDGGAVVAEGSAVLTGSTFSSCSAGNGGSGGLGGNGPIGNGNAGFSNYGGSAGAVATGGTVTITLSAFSDCSSGDLGGAVATYGPLSVTSSSFRNCSANLGGAIMAMGDSVAVSSSTFSGCTAYDGGAIGSGIYGLAATTVTSSSFTDCQAWEYGGALLSLGTGTTVISSTFSNCRALLGGAIVTSLIDSGNLLLDSSSFTHCTALIGGAVFDMNGGNTTITSTRMTDCAAILYGGAIYSVGDLHMTDSRIADCSADYSNIGRISLAAESGSASVMSIPENTLIASRSGIRPALPAGIPSDLRSLLDRPNGPGLSTISQISPPGIGGAVLVAGSDTTIVRTSITNCSAADGGGIAVFGGNLVMTSSSITECSASDHGAAIFNNEGNATVHFSRIYQDTTGTAFWNNVSDATGTFDARNNWWGSNMPTMSYPGPNVSYQPWLILGVSSTPYAIVTERNLTIRSGLTINSANENTAGSGHVPDAIISTFAIRNGSGVLSPPGAGTINGIAQTSFAASRDTSRVNISATVDDQTVFVTIPVLQPDPTPGPENDDDGPAVIPPGGSTPMNITVNIGGNVAAGKATVTGTLLSDLIVTGTVQSGPGSNRIAPPGIVYEYLTLVPSRYGTITGTLITFSVPQSWLDENHFAPGSIVLYHQTGNGWTALPTTVLYTKDGTVYFSAQSPGFSLFAITGIPPAAIPAGIATSTSGIPVHKEAMTGAFAKVPVTTQTTAPPVLPAPNAGFPFITAALIAVSGVGLIGGGMLVRRWYIRRQNPALFREYD